MNHLVYVAVSLSMSISHMTYIIQKVEIGIKDNTH